MVVLVVLLCCLNHSGRILRYTPSSLIMRLGRKTNTTITANATTSPDGYANADKYIYGAQLEAGAYATSYIPTLGAAVTRGLDACSKTGISSLIGQTEGTLFVETKPSFSKLVSNAQLAELTTL
jgi:hypothetical protein